ncbi:EAL domain-containing protein [Exiguobacterium alkaliphilum]|uniref:bifunctional diguanylate cyclase/phosphodiesterase n=1 Tax=Exiguobacterium alkaliphilum TaxID=1428684 RepID=UPI001BAD6EBD|nr:EAL domain-containing protein [Exiguobacterium alkaliphilum]QUE86295.1 EAL domain-containing protein [Exiguobacterium alkaliphilum]
MDPVVEHSMSHNLFLVVLSYMIAAVSAYAAIELARRVNSTNRTAQNMWILAGGATLGLGIWAMHFIAMLAHEGLRPVTYSMPLVFLSVVIAMAGCILGFLIVSRHTTRPALIGAGLLMGISIASMHYVGMAAIQGVTIAYHTGLALLSLAIAITASLGALWIGFFSKYAKEKIHMELKIFFSLLMGVAIFGMHYVGMLSASFTFLTGTPAAIGIEPSLLAWLVTGITTLLFAIFFLSLTLDRHLRRRELIQATILDSTTDAVVTTTKDGVIQYANTAFYRLFDRTEDQFFQDYHAALSIQQPFYEARRLEMGESTIEVTAYPLQGERMDQILWFLRDVSETIASQRLVEHMAYHDALTDLPNRHKLERILAEHIRIEDPVACLYIDIDRWRFMSDMLGHHGSDQLALQIADRLQHTIHPDDILTRVGSSEFIILLFDKRSTLAKQKAEKCIKAISQPFDIDGTTVELTMSAGISHFPKDTTSADELVQYARLAVHESKRTGKNQIKEFEEESRQQILRTVEIEKALAQALDRSEFSLVYQPKVSLTQNRLEGVEALLRWHHPVLGHVGPDEFIPIAENTGLIHQIGTWVLRESCLAWVRWQKTGVKPFTLSVNVSPLQFAREDFVDTLQATLDATGMDPMFLELEVTESSMLSYEQSTREKLAQLHQFGIMISLDDFGTGYSSFRQLRELPVQVLKIDRSFIVNLFTDRNQEAIVRSMIQLGHNLGMKVLMEGVETSDQLEWLLNEQCDYVQGYYFSRPLREKEVVKHVKSVTTYIEFGKTRA